MFELSSRLSHINSIYCAAHKNSFQPTPRSVYKIEVRIPSLDRNKKTFSCVERSQARLFLDRSWFIFSESQHHIFICVFHIFTSSHPPPRETRCHPSTSHIAGALTVYLVSLFRSSIVNSSTSVSDQIVSSPISNCFLSSRNFSVESAGEGVRVSLGYMVKSTSGVMGEQRKKISTKFPRARDSRVRQTKLIFHSMICTCFLWIAKKNWLSHRFFRALFRASLTRKINLWSNVIWVCFAFSLTSIRIEARPITLKMWRKTRESDEKKRRR